MMARSLKVPGSPSAAFTTTDVCSNGDAYDFTVRHFSPVGNPPPPRPRKPEARISSMMTSGGSARAAANPSPPPAAT
jgi:hypothetical protein